MKRNLLILVAFFAIIFSAKGIVVTYPDDFVDGWDQYIGQTVTFKNRMWVTGYAPLYGYMDGLYLSYKQLRHPDDVYPVGSDEYNEVAAENENLLNQIHLVFVGGEYFSQRIWAYADNLTAEVIGDHELYIEQWSDDLFPRPTSRPDVGDYSLLLCAFNIANYTPWLRDYTSDSAPKTEEQSARQTAKLIAALTSIDADIYAFCELQDSSETVFFIAQKLNEIYGEGTYAGVNDNRDAKQIAAGRTGFVYRTSVVKPVGAMGYPAYNNTVYGRHQYVQQFEELATGGRFTYSINHFKAGDANAQRVTNMTDLINYLKKADIDEDVIVMGDLNCASKSEPILMIEDYGYTNMLKYYSPEDFSYVYQRMVENIDQALVSPTMVSQVTGAAIYHINAGEKGSLFSWNGSYETTDMYSLSDHNPVLVGLRLNPEVEKECQNIDINEAFTSSLGTFSALNVTGKNDWYSKAEYGAVMNGANTDGSNEDWLISPALDLRGKKSATITFQHAINKGNASNVKSHHTMWISTNYTGNVNSATWEALTIPKYPAGTNWTYVNNTITLPDKYLGKESVTFAFKYISDDKNSAATWEIRNLTVKAECGSASTPDTPDALEQANDLLLVYALDGRVYVDGCDSYRIYSVTGLDLTGNNGNLQSGIYIIKTPTATTKICIK